MKYIKRNFIIIIAAVLFLVSCNKKSYVDNREYFSDEIIYVNGFENCITLPCPEDCIVPKECIKELDIGIRNLQGMNSYSWKSNQNVINTKDGWLLAVRQMGTTLEGIVVDCRISPNGGKLTIIGRNTGNAVIYLRHKSCGITRTILVTVVDWETWQKTKM
ncbi:MAG: hypothetical protein J5527_09305 [Treponema sp.]|nr:hypothetical protein [Treponema sp.]